MTPPWSYQSPLFMVWEIARIVLIIFAFCVPSLFMLGLLGCSIPTPKLSTEYLDGIAAERARSVCVYARVPVEDLPACIERGVNARQQSQLFGGWSPI